MVNIANLIAGTSGHRHFRHAVVIVLNGKIIGTGSNTSIVHAEVVAIREALDNVGPFYGATCWSFRCTKTGKLAMAKPCPACDKYLYLNGIRMVYYSNSMGAIQKMELF